MKFALLFSLAMLAGCASYKLTTPDGTVVDVEHFGHDVGDSQGTLKIPCPSKADPDRVCGFTIHEQGVSTSGPAAIAAGTVKSLIDAGVIATPVTQ